MTVASVALSPIILTLSSPTSISEITDRRNAFRAWVSPVSSFSRISWEKAARRSGVNDRTRIGLDRNPIKGSLREIALRLECVDPFFQVSVKADDAILDRAIEPVELFVDGRELGR